MNVARPFVPIADEEALDALFDRSSDSPVVLFKHDTHCPISAAAYQELAALTEPVSLLDVADSALSREVERRTSVTHESPQVLVLRNGAAAWSASHWDIHGDSVQAACREA